MDKYGLDHLSTLDTNTGSKREHLGGTELLKMYVQKRAQGGMYAGETVKKRDPETDREGVRG